MITKQQPRRESPHRADLEFIVSIIDRMLEDVHAAKTNLSHDEVRYLMLATLSNFCTRNRL